VRPLSDQTLSRVLIVRSIVVSLAVTLALTVFIALHYLIDTPRLRRLTLENEISMVRQAMARGEDPTTWDHFKRYPHNYALRVFNHRTAAHRQLAMQVNASLLPPLEGPDAESTELTLSEGFGPSRGAGGEVVEDRWQITDHFDVGERSYWVHIVMVGDPARRWLYVIGDEMQEHVLVPGLFIIPPLVLAILITTISALRPLRSIASFAEVLGRNVSQGGSLAPLPTDNLRLEFRKVVTAINVMLRELEHSFQHQKQFASDVAHELRTPLAVVALEAERLPDSPARGAITRELNDLSALVHQLLRFAQAEDVMQREKQIVALAPIARKVCEDLAAVAVRRPALLEFDAPDEPIGLLGNAALIDIAVRNIVDNAIRLTVAGSTVSVTVKRPGGVVVEDLGPGVPDEHKELIFDRFRRGDRSGTGAGIGLALVRRVARLHGGDVWVEDRDSGGARFVIEFVSSDRTVGDAAAPSAADAVPVS
jgi:signal transduction histidine kinase